MPWLVLAISWAASTWLGLQVVEAIYEGELTGGVFDSLLRESDVRPFSYYRGILWQLTSAAHFLGFLVLVVVYTLHLHSSMLLLSVLLVGDLIFVFSSLFFGGRLSVTAEPGIPEIFQYLKEISIAGSCMWLWWHRRSSAVFAGFAGLYAWLFLDDAFQYHERVGLLLATYLDLAPVASAIGDIRPQDVGEVLSLAAPLGLFVPLILYGYVKSDAFARRASRSFVGLVALLGIFGVVVDTLDRFVAFEPIRRGVFHIEDGGEMFVMSLIVAYAASLVWRTSNDQRWHAS